MGGRTRAVVGGVAAALGVAAAMAVGAGASPQSIGFDDLPDGTTVTTQYAARGIEFGPRPGGGTYDKPVVDGDAARATSDPNLGRLDLGACFPLTSTSENVVGGRFAAAQSSFSLRVMSLSGVAVPFTLQLLDAGGSIVGADNETAPADGSAGTLGATVAGGGVVFFRIAGGCDNGKKGGIDDLAFDGTDPPPPTVTTPPPVTTAPPPPGRPPPVAAIATHDAVRAGVQTPLDGSASSGDGLRYRWIFPGARRRGARARAAVATVGETTPFAIHTFAKPGPQEVTLEVTDDVGRTTSTTQTVNVTPPAEASLRGPSGPVKPGKKLSLTIPTELQGAGLSYVAWDFNDGRRVGGDTLPGGIEVPGVQATRKPAASHAYRKAGAHQVHAQVIDSAGGTTGLAATVHIGSQAQQLAAGPPPGETSLGVVQGIGASFSFTDTPATKIPVTFKNQTPGKTFPIIKVDKFGTKNKVGEAPVDNVGWKFCKSCPEIKEQGQNYEIEHTYEEAGDHEVTLRLYTIDNTFIDETTTKIHVRESKCDALKVRGITSTGSCRTPIVIGDQVSGWRTQPNAPERLGGMRLFSGGGIDLYEDSGAVVAQPSGPAFVASVGDRLVARTAGFTVPALTPNANSGEPGQAAQLVDFVHPPPDNPAAPPAAVQGLRIVGGDVRLFPGSPARATLLLELKPPFDGTVPLLIGGAAAADDKADFSIAAPDIALGPIAVRNLAFSHFSAGHADAHNGEPGWYGGADVDLGFLNIEAADRPETVPPTGLALAEGTGELRYLGASATLPTPILLGTYAQLEKIGLYVAPGTAAGQAFVVGGNVVIGVPASTPVVKVNGCAAFALFEAGESGQVCDAVYKNLPHDDTIVRVHGAVDLVALGEIGSGWVQYRAFGKELSFFAHLNEYDVLDLGAFIVSGDTTGQMNFEPSFSFQFSSKAQLEILGVDTGGEFVVSSLGLAGCVEALGGHGGASYPYGGELSFFGDLTDGCDLTVVGGVTLARRALPAATDLIAARAAQSGTAGLPSRTVTVRGRPPFVMLGATGQGGAPQIVVTGPKGERIEDDGSPLQRRAGSTVIHSTQAGRTWVYVERPSAGAWSIQPKEGSPAVTGVTLRNGLPEPRVLAKVRRAGRGYTLAYHVDRLPGQKVVFAEEGKASGRVIGSATGANGRLRFRPGPGPGGRRRIVARVTQGGSPRDNLTVAAYTAPSPPRIGKPRPKARLRGTTLRVAWKPAAGAARYRVQVRASDGRVLTLERPARRRSIVVTRFQKTTSARVTVTAIASDMRTGDPGKVLVRRRGRAPAIVL